MKKTIVDVQQQLDEFVKREVAPATFSIFDLDNGNNLDTLLNRIATTGEAALDTETTGLHWALGAHPFMMQVAPDEHSSYYTYDANKALAILDFMDNDKFTYIFHNAAFDLHMLRAWCGWVPRDGYEFMKLYDTMLAFRIRWPSSKPGARVAELKTASNRYVTDIDVDGPEKLVKDWLRDKNNLVTRIVDGHELKDKPSYDLVPSELMIPYAAQDVILTIRSAHGLMKDLNDWKQLERYTKAFLPTLKDVAAMEMKTVLTVTEMERYGVPINQDKLDELIAIAKENVEIYSDAWEATDWGEVQYRSNPQLRNLLYEVFQEELKHTTKSGAPSTADIAIADLDTEMGKQVAAIITPLRNWLGCLNRLQEIKSFVNPTTGRVHSRFKPDAARTGRFSSSEPGLQNLSTPVPDEPWTWTRSCVQPSAGKEFLLCDFSQIELRLAAYYSKSMDNINALNSGEDFHAKTAAGIFGCAVEQVTKQQRKVAKTLNFSILYGAGPDTISQRLQFADGKLSDAEAYAAFNLLTNGDKAAENVLYENDNTIFYALAVKLIARYKQANPAIMAFIKNAQLAAKDYGGVYSKFGLYMPLNERVFSSKIKKMTNQFYKAPNSIIQSTAAGMMKEALRRASTLLALFTLTRDIIMWSDCGLILTIHDEIIFELPIGMAVEFANYIKLHMTSWPMFNDIEFTLDYSIVENGQSWTEKKDLLL